MILLVEEGAEAARAGAALREAWRKAGHDAAIVDLALLGPAAAGPDSFERSTDLKVDAAGWKVAKRDAGRAEIGYLVAPGGQGRGLATEAVGALVRHAFADCAMERLEAEVFAGNEASVAVLVKNGFGIEAARMPSRQAKRGRRRDAM